MERPMLDATPTTIAEAFAAWQAARQAHDAAAKAGDEAAASEALDRATDLQGLAVTLPATTARDVLALIKMVLEPGDGCSAASEALICRAHTEAA